MHDVIDSPMARREKTVTAGAAGYISLQSLTPEKPKGTFFPPVLTPRRSPRLAAKHLAIPSGPGVSTPVREALRKSIRQREGIASLFDEVKTVVKSHYPKLEAVVVTAEAPSKLERYLLITRKLKAYDEEVGPHDALRLTVAESGQYKLMAYEKPLEEGTIQTPFGVSSLPILGKLGSAEWLVCPGVKGYSTYKSCIGYDLRRVTASCWPPDSARDCECCVFYARNHTRKTAMCDKCTLLKWRLAARKREHDQISPGHRIQHQQASSTMQFDNLSPASKKARLENMRKEITRLRVMVQRSSEKTERISLNDSQNEEMSELVKTIQRSPHGQQALQTIYREAEDTGCSQGELLKSMWEKDASDMGQFFKDQQSNVTGKSVNQWSAMTIRLALAIFSRSPAAFHAIRSMGILQLPCDKTLKGYMHKHASSPGINEEALLESSYRFDEFKAKQVADGMAPPLGEGVLIFDEVKVQSRVIWNSANSAIMGFAMSSDDFSGLHDVYEGLDTDEKCQKTTYVMQFLWRDLSCDFDVIGPYFTCPSTVETCFLHSIVIRTMLAFTQVGFSIRALLCDGASTNLALLKLLCGHSDGMDAITPWFTSPFNGNKVFLIICPSHQLKNMIAALYSSRVAGTKNFIRGGIHFGWDTIEQVYNGDLFRAKQGVSRRVPGLKYAHVVRDSWTRLNVLPAKIMQQPYMLTAIRELASHKDECTASHHIAVAEYLEACNQLFEEGILSHEVINSQTSPALQRMKLGFTFFENWHKELSQSETEVKLRSPLQKEFLAWQTWDLLRIMYQGFTGLCEEFMSEHPGYFICPLRINGSAVESIFSCLKYIAGGNLASTNYASSLAAMATQREVSKNPHSEPGYRSQHIKIH